MIDCAKFYANRMEFLRNVKFSSKGREKKRHDCISSRKFFPTPKTYKLKEGAFQAKNIFL